MYGDNGDKRIRSLPTSSGSTGSGSNSIGPSFTENVGILSIAQDNSFYAISAATKAIVYILNSTNENSLPSTYETIALNNISTNTAITSLKVSWDSQRFAVATNGAIHIYEKVCM